MTSLGMDGIRGGRAATRWIALAAAMRLQAGVASPSDAQAFDVRPRWPLTELS